MSDINRLAQAMQERITPGQIFEEYRWHNPALDVIDCVFSLNRKYEAVVRPRVLKFKENHPGIDSLSQLKALMAKHPNLLTFSQEELNYNDRRRVEVLAGVVNFLIEAQASYSGKTELERLGQWAIKAHPCDAYLVGVKGFGLAGFQYQRMLFGADTVKPDRYIIEFVSETLGRQTNPIEAMLLFERAAQQAGFPVREADYAIWQQRSGSA